MAGGVNPFTGEVVPDHGGGETLGGSGITVTGPGADPNAQSPASDQPRYQGRGPNSGARTNTSNRPEEFTSFTGSGMDIASLTADLQSRYGALAQTTGRRGSQARAILAKQGDKNVRDFLSSDAYEQLIANPSSISDTKVQEQLQAAIGDDWKKFASGQRGNQGTVNYEGIDTDQLSSFLQIEGTPFSFIKDIYDQQAEAATSEASGAGPVGDSGSLLMDIESIQVEPTQAPTVSGSSGGSTAQYQPSEVKRV